MRNFSAYQTNQNKRAQMASDTGTANKKPRAKLPHNGLRPRRSRDLVGAGESFMAIALSIMVTDILLLVENFQKRSSRPKIPAQNVQVARNCPTLARQANSPPARPSRKVRPQMRLWQEIEDLAFVVCLALLPKRRNAKAMYKAISIRAGSSNRRHRGIILRLAAFICLSLIAPRLALAEAPEVITPINLFDPESGDGVRVSPAFVLYPQATVDLTYDTNIYNVETQKTSDGVVSIRPAFVLRSDFSRHAVRLEGNAEIRQYFDISDENSEQYNLNARALLELGYGIDANAYVGYGRRIERRGTVGDLFFTDEPIAFHEKRAGIEVARTGRRLEVALAASALKRDYSDATSGGVPVDLSLRDVTVRTARIRTDFGLNARTKLFGELSGNEIDYELTSTPPRDSKGYAALVGVKHELTALVDVEAGVGYIHQNFDNPAVKSAGEINYRLAASWTPSPQWRLTASANRLVDASRSQESPAIITTEFKLTAQRAIGDRLLVGAEAGYMDENFKATPRSDKRFFVSGSTRYRLTDKVGVILSAGYRDQDGGAFGRSYKGFAGSVGVRAAW